MKRRHEFYVDEFGNRKRRRLGSAEPYEGESEADREKRRRHKERARQRMEAEEDLMQSPMYQRYGAFTFREQRLRGCRVSMRLT